MVVFIHSFPTQYNDIQLGVRQILNSAVPIFLTCSGFFIGGGQKSSTPKKHLYFLKKQVLKVYMPMIIWALPCFFYEYHSGTGLGQCIFLLACGGFSIYYFVFLIVQYYMIAPIFNFFNKFTMAIPFLISFVYIFILTYFGDVLGIPNNNLYRGGCFLLWIIFFAVGYFLSDKQRMYSVWPYILLMIIGVIASYAETLYLLGSRGSGIGIKPSSFFFSLAVIMFLFSRKVEDYIKSDNIIVRNISKVGLNSFGVYLIHCYIIIIITKVCGINSWLIVGTISFVTTIFIIKLKKQLFPYFKSYLGF